MDIGLLDIDGHNFPNLALMKISSYHKQQGHSVEFADMFGKYDIIYKSKVFSWTQDPEYIYSTNEIIKGGNGFDYSINLKREIEHVYPDYNLYSCEHAYGFLTRGCIRNCGHCIVPKKEGDIVPYSDIENFIGGYKSAILMDNNVLSSDFGIEQIKKIIKMGIKIDFNQGLDARLIDDDIAKLLSQVKWLKPLRLACDSRSQIKHIEKAVKLLRKHNCTPSRYFCYVLINDIEESKCIIEFLRKLNVDPFGQPYRDFKNTPPTWEQKKLARWVNMKKAFRTMTFDEFKKTRY